MIDILSEELMPLARAREHRLLRNRQGNAPHFTTVLGYCQRGVRGVKLDHVMKPSGYHTSELAIVRFIEKLTGGESPETKPNAGEVKKARQRSINHSMRVLENAGIVSCKAPSEDC